VNTPVNVKNLPKQKVNFLALAEDAYGDNLPDWIAALARLASETSAVAAAKRIGYSNTVLTLLFRGAYSGDLEKLEQKVRGALMGVEVVCPILGEIGADRCLDEQRMKHVGTSAIRTALFHACRSGDCPHSRIATQGGAADAA